MAFRKKAEFILNHQPDILIIPECESPEKLKFGNSQLLPTDMFWIGDNKNKGLGVLSFGDYRFSLLDKHNSDLKNILPLKVTNNSHSFSLFAIWANNPKDKDGCYITQVWKAINHYQHLISDEKIILIGDFNSNKIWDKHYRKDNHSDVVKLLENKNIYSIYHHYYQEQHGQEQFPTFFMYRKEDKPYHIDYCFTSKDFYQKLKSVEVGNFSEWSKLSDHVPFIITFDS